MFANKGNHLSLISIAFWMRGEMTTLNILGLVRSWSPETECVILLLSNKRMSESRSLIPIPKYQYLIQRTLPSQRRWYVNQCLSRRVYGSEAFPKYRRTTRIRQSCCFLLLSSWWNTRMMRSSVLSTGWQSS